MSKDTRNRGRRASREKLECAMLKAGFKNQYALAAQIALNEKTDVIPKDMVNKVFREQKVSLRNLTRVATALGESVEAILLNEDIIEEINPLTAVDHSAFPSSKPIPSTDTPTSIPLTSIPPTSLSPFNSASRLKAQINAPQAEGHTDTSRRFIKAGKINKIKKDKKAMIIFAMTLLILMVFSLKYANFAGTSDLTSYQQAIPPPKLEKYRIVVNTAQSGKALGLKTASRLTDTGLISSVYPESVGTHKIDSVSLLAHYDSDAVLFIEIAANEFHRELFVELIFEGASFNLVSTIVESAQLDLLPELIAQQVEKFLFDQTVDTSVNVNERSAFFHEVMLSDEKEAIRETVLGLNILYTWSGPDDSERAKARFYSAIQLSPDLSIPYAGLCIAYVRARYVEKETKWLELAKVQCERAQQLKKDNMFSVLANTHYLSAQGEHEKARQLMLTYLTKFEASALFKTQLAYLTIMRETPDSQVFHSAQNMLREALTVAPDYYYAYETLGTSYLYQGEALLALNTFEEADDHTENAIGLTNLSTFQFCFNRLDAASKTLARLIEQNPKHYAGYEQLARVHFVRRNYETAYRLVQEAMTQAPNIRIHQALSFFGDIALEAGRVDEGLAFLEKSIELIENDTLLGSATPADQASKLWYRWQISIYTEDYFQDAFNDRAGLLQKLNDYESSGALGLREKRLLSLMYFEIDETSKGERIKEVIVKTCPVYEFM